MKSIIAWGELELSKMRLKFGAYVLSTAFIMLLIFLFSSQDANASQKLSDGILYEILSLLRAQELMERFVRGDTSRNTEGSGLGLSIAKSLVELQNGSMELDVDGDLFKVTVSFDLYER